MAFVSPRMSLKVWNSPSDPYDHEQLADNFLKLDIHDHSAGRGAQIGAAGIQNGAISTAHILPGAITTGVIGDGQITAAKLANGLDPTPLYGINRTIRSAAIKLDAATVTGANTYALLGGGHSDSNINTTASTTNHPMLGAFWLDATDYTITGKTATFRVRLSGFPNGTAPTANFTHQMYRITSTAGGVTTIAPTFGTQNGAVTLSAIAIGTPLANTSLDFTLPGTGGYLMTVASSAAMTANSSIVLRADLQVRYV